MPAKKPAPKKTPVKKKIDGKKTYCPDSWYDPNPTLTNYVLSNRSYVKGPSVGYLKIDDKRYYYHTVTSCKNRMIKNESDDYYKWSTQAEALDSIKKNITDFIDTFDRGFDCLLMRSPLQLKHNDSFTKFSYVIRLLMVSMDTGEDIENGVNHGGY